MKKSIRLLVLLTGIAAATSSPAVTHYFTDRAAFNAAAGGGLNFESFETPFDVNGTQTFAGFQVSETAGIDALAWSGNYGGFADFVVTDGANGLWYDDNGDSISTFFNFTTPVNAFGLDITADENSVVTIGGTVSSSLNLTALTHGFFGAISDSETFSSISFDFSGGPNAGFDAVSYGTARSSSVPDAGGTALLLSIALAGLSRIRLARR
jgi:hypothetical protein